MPVKDSFLKPPLNAIILKMDEINNQSAIQKEESYDPRKVSSNLVIDLDADANEYIINEKMNGKAVDIIDLWLNYEIIFSVYTEHIVIPNDIYRLPNIEGIGRVWSLHQAMTLDESGKLKDLVVEFTKETDRDRRLEIAEQILYDWTREETVTGVLSELYNNDYTGVTEPKVLKNFNDAFEGFVIDVYENLMAASHLQKYYENRVRNSEGKEDMTVAAQDLLELLAEDQDAGEKVLADLVSNIHELLLVNEFEYDDFRDILNNANPRYGVIADGVHSNNVFGSSKSNRMSGEAVREYVWNNSCRIQADARNSCRAISAKRKI